MKLSAIFVLLSVLFTGNALADGHGGDTYCEAKVKFYDRSNNYKDEYDARKWCDYITDLFNVDRKFCEVKYDSKNYYYYGYFEWSKKFSGYDAYDVYNKIGDRHLDYAYKGENFRTHIWYDSKCKKKDY